jgi:hypothetical protein
VIIGKTHLYRISKSSSKSGDSLDCTMPGHSRKMSLAAECAVTNESHRGRELWG